MLIEHTELLYETHFPYEDKYHDQDPKQKGGRINSVNFLITAHPSIKFLKQIVAIFSEGSWPDILQCILARNSKLIFRIKISY